MTEQAQTNKVELTVLYDNEATDDRYPRGWGFACIVRTNRTLGLFDTGSSGEVLEEGLQAAGLSPRDVAWVLLSHQHADHTGGLSWLISANRRVRVYVLAKFGEELKQSVTERGATLVELEGAGALAPGVCSTGPVTAKADEQALVLTTTKGLVVLTGCAHPGLARIVRQAKDLWPGPVDLVVGGFHLKDATVEATREVIAELRSMGVMRVAPCHCSGEDARRLFREAFGSGYVECGAGSMVTAGW
ncbi:MAG: MBL fold metallo-hydrolase [Armatimonadota bacterium]|mgnify:CR=1 FL=1